MFNKILVVCVGNICRSPTAERLLRQFHPALTVSSAGLGALVGKGADPCAIGVAQAHNLSLDNHCARQISGRMCREYDLITAMEKRHISALCEMVPEMRGKVMLLVTGTASAKFPIHIVKAVMRLTRCTHYLSGLPANGLRH